jgi:hypothetical protein
MKMKTRYLFSLAALALLTAACSSDEMALTPAEQPAPAKERIPFTAVIGSTATTRVLAEAENGETITAKWQKGEKIALIHGESIDTLEVSNVDATTGAATITGDIDSPTNDEAVTVVYVGHQLGCMREFVNRLKECYEASKVDHNLTAIPADIITEVIKERLGSQDGTLETISNKLDCRYTTSTLKVSNGKATFGSKVELNPCFTIWKVNLTNEYGNTIYSSNLTIASLRADYTYVGDFTINFQGGTASSTFYVALIPDPEVTLFNFSAEISSYVYSGNCFLMAPLEIGLFYTSTVKIQRNDYAG